MCQPQRLPLLLLCNRCDGLVVGCQVSGNDAADDASSIDSVAAFGGQPRGAASSTTLVRTHLQSSSLAPNETCRPGNALSRLSAIRAASMMLSTIANVLDPVLTDLISH